MGAKHVRSAGGSRAQARGQHFLRSTELARELVREAGIRREHLVVDVGAGFGMLTAPLARVAGHVVALESDPRLCDRLRTRFAADARVEVVQADALGWRFPRAPFRIVANVPFSITAPLLRRLLDDRTGGLKRADLVVQWGVARKRATQRSLLGSLWGPWWEFSLGRRLSARSFQPAPSVDAGILRVCRRGRPLLPDAERADYAELVEAGYRDAGAPLRSTVRRLVPPKTFKRWASNAGLDPAVRAIDLDVSRWLELLRSVPAERRSG